MAELSPQERLQPSLLDRLTDHDPEQKIESRDRRVLSMQRLRDFVRRDLSWLLNTGRLESVIDLELYPEVAESVLNYGIPDLCGINVSGADTQAIEKEIRKAIIRFEPRLLKHSLRVTVETNEQSRLRAAMVIRIEAELWGEPVSQEILFESELDLETGSVSIKEGR